ncbi:MAG: family 10 glycosylhydrolase [Tannerellaceae bacterium]|jgi:uncharacterized lipoprotein YddW (UPF0748 family)|nr:family 10 glycosylhydrolase [Tannerellaceae bacterium]
MKTSLLLLLTLLLQPLGANNYPKREIRGVWITTLGGMDWPAKPARDEAGRKAQQKDLCEKLDLLREANFNVVFLQVRLRGDLIYPSEIEPMNRIFSGRYAHSPGYDPLAFAVAECHRRGLECHAWFITYPVGTQAEVRSKGSNSVVARRPELCKFFNGQWYLNPGLPETSDYILALVREMLTNYDVDGIHFDRIRYPENAERFPDDEAYARYGKSHSLRAWRQASINRMVRRIYLWVKRHRPWVQVSLCPLGKFAPLLEVPEAGLTAYDVYQDPLTWLREQTLDMIVPMMYYRDSYFYPFVDHWTLRRNGRLFVAGLGAYKLTGDGGWTLEDLVSQMDYVRSLKADGLTFFRGAQLFGNSRGLYTVLKEKYFRYPSLLPPLTWLSEERPAAPVNLRLERQGRLLRLSWSMPEAASHAPSSLRYTVYFSRSGRVNTLLAQHILVTGLMDSEIYLSAEAPEEELSFRVTASDRYHRESRPSREVYYFTGYAP